MRRELARLGSENVSTTTTTSAVPYRRTFISLLGFLRPYKVSLIVSTILAVLSQAAAIAIVLLVGEAIEGIEERRGTETLVWVVAAIMAVGVVKAVLMVGRRIISARRRSGSRRTCAKACTATCWLSFGFYDRHQTGQLMSRATVDLQSVRFFLGFGLIFFFQHILTIASVMVVLLRDRVGAGAHRARNHAADRRGRLSVQPRLASGAPRGPAKLGDVATVTEESIVGVHVVKAFAQEERRQTSSSAPRERSSTRRAGVPPAGDLRAAALVPAVWLRARCCSPPDGWS